MVGAIDLMAVMLVFLPLYGNRAGEEVIPVNLISYTDRARPVIAAYWILIILTMLTGAVKVFLYRMEQEKYRRYTTGLSIMLGVITVIVMAMTRQPYGVTVVFLLFVIKAALIWRME